MRRIGRRNFLQAGAGLLSAMGLAGKARAGRERRLEYQISYETVNWIVLQCREYGAKDFVNLAACRSRNPSWRTLIHGWDSLALAANTMNLPIPNENDILNQEKGKIRLGNIGLMTFEKFEKGARLWEKRYLVE